jgi:hypothetical protein
MPYVHWRENLKFRILNLLVIKLCNYPVSIAAIIYVHWTVKDDVLLGRRYPFTY